MTDKKSVTLWNPNVAACLSILFTPIFGAWIHAKNWEKLGKDKEKKWSMLFVYGLIIVTLFAVLYDIFIGSVKSSPLSLGILLTWYFSLGKSQINYVKKNNEDYIKKSWIKPVTYSLGGYIVFFGLIFVLVAVAPINKNDIEITSKDLVNQIISEQLQEDIICETVSINEELGNGEYKALATLNNGEKKDIKIKHENDMIYVEILDNNILSSP